MLAGVCPLWSIFATGLYATFSVLLQPLLRQLLSITELTGVIVGSAERSVLIGHRVTTRTQGHS